MAWVMVFHILGLVFWMSGLLVATQVLAMHAREPSTEARTTLTRLEAQLLKGVTHPGAAITVVTGVILVAMEPGLLRHGWLRAKILLVFVLIALDLIVYFRTRALHAGEIKLDGGWCRIMHGAISLVLIGIIVLVIVKPA